MNIAVPGKGATESIVGNQTSACQGCATGQEWPLFLTATYYNFTDYLGTCWRPRREIDRAMSPEIIDFIDPPRTWGVGIGSGGPNASIGVMTFNRSGYGSWLETCTLPPSDNAICDTSRNLFTQDYGNR